VGALGDEDLDVRGLELHDVQQGVDVDVLLRQAAAEHVVRVRHDLDAGALEVGVHDAGLKADGLTGLEGEAVEQQRGEDAGVAREVLVELDGRLGEQPQLAGRVEVPDGGGEDLVDQVPTVAEGQDV